jgi:D-3-phosphoglycerate dehydrogenase
VIGAVGTLLGNADINIASMVVARDTPRGESTMALSLDAPVPPPVFDQLRAQPDIDKSAAAVKIRIFSPASVGWLLPTAL